jgi:hypothetical protein
MGSLLIKNAQIISMNEQNDIFTGDIFIKDDLIAADHYSGICSNTYSLMPDALPRQRR